MRIATNVDSLSSWRALTSNDSALQRSLERLSSGQRVSGAADDAAGLAVSEKMRAQARGMGQAVKNASDGISMLQTAEATLGEVHAMLQRMRELAVQSATGTLTPGDRSAIQDEMDSLTAEVTRVATTTQFNLKDLVDGSLQAGGRGEVSLQVGPNQGHTMSFSVGAMDAATLGIARDVMGGLIDNGTGVVGPYVTDAIHAVGPGMDAGQVRVVYLGGKVELRDMAGNTIGAPVDFLPGGRITVGDPETARTVELTLRPFAPGDGALDTLTLGSAAGKVATDPDDLLSPLSGAVSAVGPEFSSGTYRVAYTFGPPATLQLQDSGGAPLGAPVPYAAGSTVSLGDSAQGRTAAVATSGTPPAADTVATITVENNGMSAEAATFSGGARMTGARAFAGLNVSAPAAAGDAISALDTAINRVSSQRSQLGAVTNRLEHAINNLRVEAENLVAADSRIRDTDMAREMTQLTKTQILQQSGVAMLAQANKKPQNILRLLQQ